LDYFSQSGTKLTNKGSCHDKRQTNIHRAKRERLRTQFLNVVTFMQARYQKINIVKSHFQSMIAKQETKNSMRRSK
jgi:hypothetical protein